MSPLKLTARGEFMRLHTVITPIAWWEKTIKELRRAYEADEDWGVLLQERIAGMTELLDEAKAHRILFPESYGPSA